MLLYLLIQKMVICFFLLFWPLSIDFVVVIGQESYGAYAGLPAEGINGAGIAGNGDNLDREGEIAQGVNIRKAPIAPVAPPRVPIPLSFIDADEMTAYRRAPPPPTRREVRSEGQCQLDTNKWRVHPQSAVANAIMFDRTSGIRCDECLKLCITKYQDESNAWICRSVTYDHRWKICDLFAVNGTTSPYFLVDFKGRDYFDFLPALPPSDSQLNALPGLPPAEVANATPTPSQHKTNDENSQQLLDLTKKDASRAENENCGTRGTEEGQCLCPCKMLADKTAFIGPKREEAGNGTEVEDTTDASSNTTSSSDIAALLIASDSPSANTAPSPSSDNSSSVPPLPFSATAISTDITARSSSIPDNVSNNETVSEGVIGNNLLAPPFPPPSDPLTIGSLPTPSPGALPFENQNQSSSPTPATISVPAPPNDNLLPQPESNLTESSSSPPVSSPLPPPPIPTIPSSDLMNVSTPNSSNASSEFSSVAAHRALSSKTFHQNQQAFREIRLPFHKTGQKLNKMSSSLSAKRPTKIHEVLKACPKKGQLAHYVEVSDYQRLLTSRRGGTNSIEEIGAKDVAECMDACDAPIRLSTCNSAVFSAAHRCELSTSAANHSAPDSLLAAPKFKYVEKICLDAALSRGNDQRRVFPAVIGRILVGHVQEVFNAGSLSECVKACLMAESSYGFVCKSLMFYPTDADQNCLMNSESRFSQSDVFVLEDQNVHMLYVDMEQPRHPAPLPLSEDERRRFKDIPLGGMPEKDGGDQWTLWSKCLNSSVTMVPEIRHRYRKCREAKDVRKCPKESMPCRKIPKSLKIQRIGKPTINTTTAEQSDDRRPPSDCLAVRDALGRKRCPYGMRWTGTQREFCSKPIDC